MRKLIVAAILTVAVFLLSFPLERALSQEQPHYKEGVPTRVRAVICDDAEKALSLLETWRKFGNPAANAELGRYNRMFNNRGTRACGIHYGAVIPLRRFASVEGLSLPKSPNIKMTWHVIAVKYGHLFSEAGFMLSRYPMKPKTPADPT